MQVCTFWEKFDIAMEPFRFSTIHLASSTVVMVMNPARADLSDGWRCRLATGVAILVLQRKMQGHYEDLVKFF